jgi:hypothetical protein
LGFNAYKEGYGYGFVTAGHCNEYGISGVGWVDSTEYYQPIVADTNHIGVEVLDPPFVPCGQAWPCRDSEAIFAEYDDTASFWYGYLAKTTEPDTIGHDGSRTISGFFMIVDKIQRPPYVGEFLYKVGYTTGWTGQRVTHRCKKEDYKPAGDLLCQAWVGAGAGPGDSGSPVFKIVSGPKVVLYGVLWWVANDSSWFKFSPMSGVEADLGTLHVYDDMDVTIIGPTEVPPHDVCEWEADIEGGISPYSYKWYRDGDLVSTDYYYLTYDTGDPDTEWSLWVDVTDAGQNVDSDRITVYVDHGFECSAK